MRNAPHASDAPEPTRPFQVLHDPLRLRAVSDSWSANRDAAETFDRFCRLTARLLNVPIALVTHVAADRQILLGRSGVSPTWAERREMPLENSFCIHALRSTSPLVIPDAREDARTRPSPAVSEHSFHAYLGVPIRAVGGEPLGTLCVVDRRPRDWSEDEISLLRESALQVAALLELNGKQAGQHGSAATLEESALEEQVRKRTAELETERAFLRAIIDAAPVAVFGRDARGRYTLANQVLADWVGRSRESILGRTDADFGTNDELVAGIRSTDQEVLSGSAPAVTQRLCVTDPRSGEERWFDLRKVRFTPPGGGDPQVLGVSVEITDQIRTQRVLQESEARLKDAQRIGKIGHWEWRIPEREMIWSDETYRILHEVPQSFHPSHLLYLDRIPEPERSHASALLQETLEQGGTLELEHPVRISTGEHRLVITRGEVTLDEGGQPLRMVGTVQDVSERRRLEQVQRQTEAQLESILDHAPSAVFAKDLQGRYILVNRRFCELMRVSPDEALGRTDAELLPGHEVEQYAVHDRAVLEAGEPLQFEETLHGPDGATITGLTMKFPLRSSTGEIYAVCGISTDITSWKAVQTAIQASEERYRQLVDVSPDAIAIYRDERLVFVNPAGVRLSGAASADELLGRSIFDMLHPDSWAVARERLRRLTEDGAPNPPAELRFRRVDGGIIYGETVSIPFSFQGTPAVQVIVRDVTERHLAHEALERSEARLRMAQRMEAIGRLTGGIAHDFNNILNVIGGNLQLILMDLEEDSPLREELSEIDQAAGRAADLTRQLLAFSRQQILQPRVLDLNTMVRGVEKMLIRLLGEDIEILKRLDPEIGPVKADPSQVEQILVNLAVNARDAMPTGGQLIMETHDEEVSAADFRDLPYEVQPGSYVVLSVSDTGTGIPAEIRDRVFEPFFTTKAPGRGTGLGLATVYGIVKQSDGYIWVEERAGGGSTFRIYLPRVEERIRDEPDPPVLPRRGTGTILLVEDEDAVRRVARRALERSGYRVLDAPDGEEALRLIEAHPEPIDLLLTDVVMPRMSGRELATRVEEVRPGTPVLYTSGYTDEAVLRHGIRDAEVPFLQKPYDPQSLTRKVAEILAR